MHQLVANLCNAKLSRGGMVLGGAAILAIVAAAVGMALWGGKVPLPTPPPRASGPTVAITAPLIPQQPEWHRRKVDFPLIPRPKETQASTSPAPSVDRHTRILVARNAPPLVRQGASELRAVLEGACGAPPEVAFLPATTAAGSPVTASEHVPSPTMTPGKSPAGLDILILEAPSTPPGQVPAGVPRQSEGYRLEVTPTRVTVAGRDARGAYWGVQTLKQLVGRDHDGKVTVKSVSINDWPSLATRGVHWTGGRLALVPHRQLIERVLAPLKINTLLYETQYAQWQSQPGLWDPTRSTPLADLREEVACARARGIEPIPLVSTLSHCKWLFRQGANADLFLVQDLYNPAAPRTYEVVTRVFEEAIAIFRPRLFNIGHDEVSGSALGTGTNEERFGRDRLHPGVRVVADDAIRLHDWLKSRNVGTMMWADQLLYGSEASDSATAGSLQDSAYMRQALPKDIVLVDWHYNHSPSYPSLPVLQSAGFRVLGAPWADPHNIESFTRTVAQGQALGTIQTTWTGYETSPRHVVGSELHQFVAFVVAAEEAWNGGAVPVDRLGYDPEDVFLSLYQDSREITRQLHPAVAVDLRGVANANTLVWGSENGVDPKVTLPRGRAAFGGVPYDLQGAVLLAGQESPVETGGPPAAAPSPSPSLAANPLPGAIEISLAGRNIRKIDILWATMRAGGGEVAQVTVTAVDGSQAEMGMSYVNQVLALGDPSFFERLPRAWEGRLACEPHASLHRWEWANPHPKSPLQGLRISSTGTPAFPLVLAITAQLDE